MMVNEFKPESVPWQSTVPQQMPWMSLYQPVSYNMQFGGAQQQPFSAPGPSNAPLHPYDFAQHQLHSIAGGLQTATTTTPITMCPTTLAPNTVFTSGLPSVPHPNSVTTTTQSYPSYYGPPLQHQLNLNLSHPPITHQQPPIETSPVIQDIFCTGGCLTHLPGAPPTTNLEKQHKRSSVEMMDEHVQAAEPPTKQLLSEKKLFKQFGSLQLNPKLNDASLLNGDEDSDEDLDDSGTTEVSNLQGQNREEFNRYVYLLFKDKKKDGKFLPSNNTLDRLAREERDKLNKALVLWNPPIKNNFYDSNEDSSDDDELQYKDHRDFLKRPQTNSDRYDSVIITEITDSSESGNQDGTQLADIALEDDDSMLE